jgi:uncharacterized protein YcbX
MLSKALGSEVNLTASSSEPRTYEEYWPDIEGTGKREKFTDEVMPPNTFFDLAAVHVLTTATLNSLRKLYPEGRFDTRRFRPNIVIEPYPGTNGFVENGWVGQTLRLGDEVRLKITRSCKRCVMTTLAQGDLPRDLGILRTAARYNEVRVGVYASVESGGNVTLGDHVWVN